MNTLFICDLQTAKGAFSSLRKVNALVAVWVSITGFSFNKLTHQYDLTGRSQEFRKFRFTTLNIFERVSCSNETRGCVSRIWSERFPFVIRLALVHLRSHEVGSPNRTAPALKSLSRRPTPQPLALGGPRQVVEEYLSTQTQP